MHGDFNPRSPRGERRAISVLDNSLGISIHAPLAGSDYEDKEGFLKRVISIHAPLAGSDDVDKWNDINELRFQSTLPSRGATL